MSGVGSILRVLGALVALLVTIITSFVGVKLLDGLVANLRPPAASLGWPEFSVVYEYAALALIGVSIVIILWMILARVRQDTRQELQPRRPF